MDEDEILDENSTSIAVIDIENTVAVSLILDAVKLGQVSFLFPLKNVVVD